MQKKAQMVFFMLAAVIVLLLISYGLWLIKVRTIEPIKKELPSQQALGDVAAVSAFVTSCVQQTLNDALILFGVVGGKTGYFVEFFPYDPKYQIPYYFVTNNDLSPGRDLSPSKADLEEKILARYMNNHLRECTAGFRNVKGLVVEDGVVSAQVGLNAKDVSAKVSYPVTVIQGNKRTVFDIFAVKIPSRLSTMLDVSHNIVKKAQEHEDIVYWDFLTDVTNMCEVLTDPRGDPCLNITAHAERDNTIVYRIIDPQSKVYFEPYFFQFAVKVRVK